MAVNMRSPPTTLSLITRSNANSVPSLRLPTIWRPTPTVLPWLVAQ
jgi:hypothetical protein